METNTLVTSGIKSKDRVKQHGEVFTPDSIVNDMLDLVDKSVLDTIDMSTEEGIWEYINKTYLEPSCGNGNFLVRILDRKLAAVQKLPREQWEFGLVVALSKIYAIDIQDDNVIESRARLLSLIETGVTELLELPDKELKPFNFEKYELSDKLRDNLKVIINNNIIVGNALNGKKYLYGEELTEDIILIDYIWNLSNKTVMCSGHTLDDIKGKFSINRLCNEAISDYLDLVNLDFEAGISMNDF